MKRFQAIEFEDYRWFPHFLRDYMTDFYHFQMDTFNLYNPAVEQLHALLKTTGLNTIIDLCSGGAGPLPKIREQLKERFDDNVKITLTDYYPNYSAFERIKELTRGAVDYYQAPVNAMCIPEELTGVRTIFSAFHHFKPDQAVSILKDAVDKSSPIAVFELSNRSIASFMQVLLAGPLSMPFITPFLRPFTLKRIIFTYLVPLLPFLCMWDGAGSNLRAYTPEEMADLIFRADRDNRFAWESGKLKSNVPGVMVTFLTGRPK
jgi:hypothetical protein